MEPFYSIQEIADILDKGVSAVCNGLVAAGVPTYFNGKKIDLPDYDCFRAAYSGERIFVRTGCPPGPNPSTIFVSSETLPAVWTKKLSAEDGLEKKPVAATMPEKLTATTEQAPMTDVPPLQIPDGPRVQTGTAHSGAQKATPDDWKVSARAIADELHEKDTRAGAHDSITNIAKRVAVVMRSKGIHGPRAPLTGSTIAREALQGKKWTRKS